MLGKITTVNNVHVETREGSGRCLVALKPLAHGALLVNEAPYVAVVDEDSLDRACSACFEPADGDQPLLRCSACQTLRYCSPTCQRADWAIHKGECASLKRLRTSMAGARSKSGASPVVPPTDVRLMCRLLLKRSQDPAEFDRVMGPMVSNKSLHGQAALQAMGNCLVMVRSLLANDALLLSNADKMLEMTCKMAMNAMKMERAVGLFELLPTINHSCAPNASIVFGLGGVARLVAMEPIAAGEELFVSYIDMFQARRKRQQELKTRFLFDCRCRLCSNDKPGPTMTVGWPVDDVRDVLQCTNANDSKGKRCNGRWTEESKHEPCSLCGSCDVAARDEVLVKVAKVHALYDHAAKNQHSDPQVAYTDTTKALNALAGLTVRSHSLVIQLRSVLIEILIGQLDYKQIAAVGQEQLASYKDILGQQTVSGSNGSSEIAWPMVSTVCTDIFYATQWIETADLSKVEALGKDALSRLCKSHGEQHPISCRVREVLTDVQHQQEAIKQGKTLIFQ
ncbi:hypothetical protein BC831DRAFT_471672 [Entophlyctis helioformis]|nr:hypothetical protein BC831DRAFT_471672 [Entophlyctis helioformis]